MAGFISLAACTAEAPAPASPSPQTATAAPTVAASPSVQRSVRAEATGTTTADGLPEYVVTFTGFPAGAQAVFVGFTNARGQPVNPVNPNYTISGPSFRARRAIPDKVPAASYVLKWTVDGVAYDVPLAFAAAQTAASPSQVAAQTATPPATAPTAAPATPDVTPPPPPVATPTIVIATPAPAQATVTTQPSTYKIGASFNVVYVFRGFAAGSKINYVSSKYPDGRSYQSCASAAGTFCSWTTTGDPYGVGLTYSDATKMSLGTYTDTFTVNGVSYKVTWTLTP